MQLIRHNTNAMHSQKTAERLRFVFSTVDSSFSLYQKYSICRPKAGPHTILLIVYSLSYTKITGHKGRAARALMPRFSVLGKQFVNINISNA